MAEEKKKEIEINPDEEKAYKEILAKEMKEKIKNKIENEDAFVIKTLREMLQDDK